VGRRDLIEKINKNPMKRALRVDKMRIAILEATLRLYRDPDRLAEKLPTIRLLARPKADIVALAERCSRRYRPRSAGRSRSSRSTVRARSVPARCRPRRCRAPGLRSGNRGHGAREGAGGPHCGAASIADAGDWSRRGQRAVLDLRCLEDGDSFLANLAKLDEPPMRWLDRLARRPHNVAAEMAGGVRGRRRRQLRKEPSNSGRRSRMRAYRGANNIGACFAEGLGVDRDPALAVKWLTVSAEGGDSVGQRNLAAAYFKGEVSTRLRASRPSSIVRRRAGRRAGAGHAELDAARR